MKALMFTFMKKLAQSQKGKKLIFILLLLLTGYFFGYYKLIGEGLIGDHIWRQADGLSIAQNFYQHGMRFFEPEIHNQVADHGFSGKSAGEFPLWYYLQAVVWKLTGPTPFTFRLFSLILTFIGLFAFYRVLQQIFKNDWVAFILPLLLFTSPVYAIYGISFLTDVPAFSLSLIAWYYIYLYFTKRTQKRLWTAMILFGLAGLLKISSLIGFVFLLLVFVLELFGFKSLKNKFLFAKSQSEWLAFIIIPVVIASWYFYARWFNHVHQVNYFLTGIWTYFDLNPAEQKDYLGNIRDVMLYAFYSKSVLFLLLFGWIANFFLLGKMPRFAMLAALIVPVGVILYVILWSGAFRNHDYYFIPLLHLMPGIFIPFLLSFKRIDKQDNFLRPLKVLTLVLLGYNMFYCGSFVYMRHYGHRGEFIMAGPSESVFANKYIVKNHETHWKPFKAIDGFLTKAGVQPEHKVICPTDITINASLYLMNRNGWTGFQSWDNDSAIQQKIDLGAFWLIVHEEENAVLSAFQNFTEFPAGRHHNLLLFDLRPYRKT
ncbi:MAG: hypothetical protein CVT92_03905 [Bacteroidetes bacterium HGW-Bacteroidetes-1]|jgi:4-amino-4-deoxy-L-arabinose transferase-like glycosyltransferase|nr:MAG: hypothetical protein CVT92_03905 [Bacteroidetes bacterium HGW-Bacteroidetes-1]